MPAGTPGGGGPLSVVVAAIRGRPVLTLMVVNLLIGAVWMARTQPQPFSDYYVYYKFAAGMLDEHQFGYPSPTARRLPGYPALLAVLMLISRSYVWLAICNLVLNTALLPIVHRLTLSMFSGNRRLALVTAILCALNPTFLYFSPIIASEHAFVLLIFSTLLVLYSTRLQTRTRMILSGALLGLAVLTRGDGAFYTPVVLFVAWMTIQKDRARKIGHAAILLATVLLVTLPWAVRNRIVIGPGAGLSTVSGVNFYYGHNPDQYGYHSLRGSAVRIDNEGERQREWFRRGMNYLRSNPSRLFDDIAKGTNQLLVMTSTYAVRAALVVRSNIQPEGVSHRKKIPWGSMPLVTWFYRAMAVLAAVALFFVRRMGWRTSMVLYGMVLMNWVCYAVVFWGKPRFRYTAEVVMCILAGYTLLWLWDLISHKLPRATD